MGCDIHAVVQARQDGRWTDVESEWNQRRHYFLFAWLADVRNGYGFAGTPTHDPITPIAPRRGLPSDFTIDGDEHEGEWIGEHSYSWLTADEILAAPPPGEGAKRTGVVTLEQFRAWDGNSQPREWCGAISGPGVRVAASPAVVTDDTTHVTIEWPVQADEVGYFVDEVRRLKQQHGDVRIVFGFDS